MASPNKKKRDKRLEINQPIDEWTPMKTGSPNMQCGICEHKNTENTEGFCYMFREKPEEYCMQFVRNEYE